jgi:MscS family membrane protein
VLREDQRVRFHRVAPYSFDVEIFAYVAARDWNEFLQIQEQLLFGMTEAVERAGTALALPSQTTYVAGREPQEGGKRGPVAEGRGALTGLG